MSELRIMAPSIGIDDKALEPIIHDLDIVEELNWRPISLLSNMYKILSRAINTRLNKIVNRVCSRSQKGFYNSRYTQEVLINV